MATRKFRPSGSFVWAVFIQPEAISNQKWLEIIFYMINKKEVECVEYGSHVGKILIHFKSYQKPAIWDQYLQDMDIKEKYKIENLCEYYAGGKKELFSKNPEGFAQFKKYTDEFMRKSKQFHAKFDTSPNNDGMEIEDDETTTKRIPCQSGSHRNNMEFKNILKTTSKTNELETKTIAFDNVITQTNAIKTRQNKKRNFDFEIVKREDDDNTYKTKPSLKAMSTWSKTYFSDFDSV